MLLHLTDISEEPLHSQISRQLIEKILDGDLENGTELDSIHTLARAQHVSVNTVKRAYATLEQKGLITLQPGKGFLVATLTPEQKQAIALQQSLGSRSLLNVVEHFSRELISVFDPEKLRAIVIQNLQQHLQTEQIYFTIYDDRTDEFMLLPTEDFPEKVIIPKNEKLVHVLSQFRIPVKIEAVQFNAKDSSLVRALQARAIRLLVPLHEGSQLLGFLGLSGRTSGLGYNKEEMNLLMVLANQFVTALTTARFYVEAVEKRRFEEELNMARLIQADLLPKQLPVNADFELAGYSIPSRAVGGDFYDSIPIDQQRTGLVIADACGSGLPAALLISQIQAMIRSEVHNGNDIAATLSHLNQQVVHFSPKDKFVTLVYGIYDAAARTFEYASAGHDYPVVVRENGRLEFLNVGGPALGFVDSATFEIEKIRLNSGDSLLFYTDGITETMNAFHEEYGVKRLGDLLRKNRQLAAKALVKVILNDLAQFGTDDSLQDDRTILILKQK